MALEEVLPAVSNILADVSERTFVPFRQCAWCGGINLAGHYVRIPGLRKSTRQISAVVPMVGRVSVSMSHGICPTCADHLLASGDSF